MSSDVDKCLWGRIFSTSVHMAIFSKRNIISLTMDSAKSTCSR